MARDIYIPRTTRYDADRVADRVRKQLTVSMASMDTMASSSSCSFSAMRIRPSGSLESTTTSNSSSLSTYSTFSSNSWERRSTRSRPGKCASSQSSRLNRFSYAHVLKLIGSGWTAFGSGCSAFICVAACIYQIFTRTTALGWMSRPHFFIPPFLRLRLEPPPRTVPEVKAVG